MPSLGPFSESSEMAPSAVATLVRDPEFAPSPIDLPELDAEPSRASTVAIDAALAPDSLSTGILFVLVATFLQRLVGMVRSVLFCDMLSEAEVGLFSLGFSSLVLL